jgi:hypothetical protein
MNTLVYAAAIISILVGVYFLVSRELKGAVITPDYVPYMPSQKGASRGGFMMYVIENLGVPGWYWGDTN